MADDKVIHLNGSAPDWTPQERRLWLASHNAPANLMLVSKEEMQLMASSMTQQRALVNESVAQIRAFCKLLGEYDDNEPDVVNAVGSAVFDARRYKKAVELAAPKLQKLKDALDALAKSSALADRPSIVQKISGLEDDLAKVFVLLVDTMAQRRQRILPERKVTK